MADAHNVADLRALLVELANDAAEMDAAPAISLISAAECAGWAGGIRYVIQAIRDGWLEAGEPELEGGGG